MEEVQSADVPEETAVSEVTKDGAATNGANSTGTPRHRRPAGSAGGHSRYGHRRSPTTGHRVRRQKTPEPNFVSTPERDERQKKESGKRSLSSPGEGGRRRISSSEEEEEERQPRRVLKTKANESTTKTKLEASKRWSAMTLGSMVSSESSSNNLAPKPALRTRSKSRGREENERNDGEKSSWWKSWPSWTQRIRGKSLEREPGEDAPLFVPPRRNRSLERPPVIKEKERKASAKQEKPPVAKKRSKSKTRTVSDEERRASEEERRTSLEERRTSAEERRKSLEERRISIEESSDEFWKSENSLRKRIVINKEEEPQRMDNDEELQVANECSKQLVLVETSLVLREFPSTVEEVKEVQTEVKESFSLRETYLEVCSEWKSFVSSNTKEVLRIRILRNHCIASFAILVMYCGTGAIVFRFTEGAFESFYKCGVKRVKRDFVDGLWMSSHNLREEEWKSLARRKLMEFEEQLHTAYEAGMTSYSGLKAWSFLNAFIYCLTVVTTIGYGHISPSTTTGRAITIVYAIFGIPMFLILLADFGKLFTRGIKFIWAFVRRVYYTGSCKKVRRTVPVQEMMKGVQMVYDIATFRRPSQLPPGVMLDEGAPPPLPPRVYTPGEPPGTPALSTFAIDDEFNLPISVAIFILLIYIICGATVFYIWESWGFFESFYFVFISMSTIGFGDFVPQNQMYMMASIVYLVFGLALTSMCINVVQEKLSDSFRQASAKIGATIGLRVAEEDGAVTPVAPAPVEMPEVHGGARSNPSPTTPPTTSAVIS